jgi:hypothetical protein
VPADQGYSPGSSEEEAIVSTGTFTRSTCSFNTYRRIPKLISRQIRSLLICTRYDSRSRIIKGFFLQFALHATRIAAYCAGAMPQRINPEPEGRSVTCALTRQQQQKVGVTAAFPWQLTYAYAAVRYHHSGGKWMQS